MLMRTPCTKPAEDQHIVYNDWRDLRNAIDRAEDQHKFGIKTPTGYPKGLWDILVAVIEQYYPLKARCIHCRSVFPWQEIYRCVKCNSPLCKSCAKKHAEAPIHTSFIKNY
jgi:hypothetical protein